MNSTQHYTETDLHFAARYGLTLDDTGFTPEHIEHRYGDLSPREAAEQIARDYDVQPIDTGWR